MTQRLFFVCILLVLFSVAHAEELPTTAPKPPCAVHSALYTFEDIQHLHAGLDVLVVRLLTGQRCAASTAANPERLAVCRELLKVFNDSRGGGNRAYIFRANKTPVVIVGIQADGTTVYKLAVDINCMPTQLEELQMMQMFLLQMLIDTVPPAEGNEYSPVSPPPVQSI